MSFALICSHMSFTLICSHTYTSYHISYQFYQSSYKSPYRLPMFLHVYKLPVTRYQLPVFSHAYHIYTNYNTVKASGVDPIKNKMMNEQRNNGTTERNHLHNHLQHHQKPAHLHSNIIIVSKDECMVFLSKCKVLKA